MRLWIIARWRSGIRRFETYEAEGVGCVVEIGGKESPVKSVKCTRRGGIASMVGYLSRDKGLGEMKDLLPLLIDRRVNLRCVLVVF